MIEEEMIVKYKLETFAVITSLEGIPRRDELLEL